MMRPFEHASVPLGGVNLIEASAGTGKTHAIAGLYLRLLLETDLPPEAILVVTYTEAATGELRGRIRERIRVTFDQLSEAGDPLAVLRSIGDGAVGLGREKALFRLERALSSFDLAAIHTIHAFALRALREHAFATGSLYDTRLEEDQERLVMEVVDDFWRRRFFDASSPLAGLERCRKELSVEFLRELLRSLHPGPLTAIVPVFSQQRGDDSATACRECYEALSAMWHEEREAVAAILLEDPALRREADKYRRDSVERLIEGMDAYVDEGLACACFPGFRYFSAMVMQANLKKGCAVASHPFFDLAAAMMAAIEERTLMLKAELVEVYGRLLPERKHRDNVRFFDDLLIDLYEALDPAGDGNELAGLLRHSYRAALIDEFQDTDPLQYEIFVRIYGGSGMPLFLIGDPKQAIYSFRGADLFAYLRAASDVDPACRFSLARNWRSVPRLLDGFNRLFANGSNPFMFEDIAYQPISSGLGDAAIRLVDDDCPEAPPLAVWMLDHGGDGPISVEAGERQASLAVAAEVVRMLEGGLGGRVRIGQEPLKASDIAVVVCTHRQGALVYDALVSSGVPAVVRTDRSVFSTRIARELLILLEALAEPGNEGMVRAALATPILGRTAGDIAALLDDEEAWVAVLVHFARYHQLWQERGVMVMLRRFMQEEGVRGRLLGREGGERNLTDLMHCLELLHGREHASGRGIESLLSWYGEKLADDTHCPEEEQMRLETDRSAVMIVTVHVSKGLQYPVVFAPFHWKGVKQPDGVALFHDGEGEAKRDFGSPSYAEGIRLAWREALAESLRLFYVALTRARYRCVFMAGAARDGASPIAYLLQATEEVRGGGVDTPSMLIAECASLGQERMAAKVERFVADAAGSVGFRQLSAEALDVPASLSLPADGSPLPFRHLFRGEVDASWSISSFTSFSRHGRGAAELPDRDGGLLSAPSSLLAVDPLQGTGVFGFDRGAKAGTFLHGVFERIDFAAPDLVAVQRDIAEGLERHAFSPAWEEPLLDMVRAVLEAPLGSDGEPFRLGALGRGKWVCEMEFFMPLALLCNETLGSVLRENGSEAGSSAYARLAAAIDFKPVGGMLMGFMDMVFEAGGRWWLLDWKSNYLGDEYADYGRDGMEAAMQEHRYHLQYLLYTVALDRYLSGRVPGYRYERHFGGVIYVFLRGVKPGSSATGFYHARPSADLIGRLSSTFNGGGAS